MIPRKKIEALRKLADQLARRRVVLRQNGRAHTNCKANHAAYLLEERGGGRLKPISYGENHMRHHRVMSMHAEKDALQNATRKHISPKEKKSYSLLVVKVSNARKNFGLSNCCVRCQRDLLNSKIHISRVYFSTPDGVGFEKGIPGQMRMHICEMDRNCAMCSNNEDDLETALSQ